MYDVAIIGAGMSGLAAGVRLAHYDQKVVVLERHYAVGGLNSFYRLRGRFFDVGLHAVTNFAKAGARHGPLPRLLRQLRMKWDDFALREQVGSAVAFPDATLRFTNDFELFRSEVHRRFPVDKDNFERLVAMLPSYDDAGRTVMDASAREILEQNIGDPLLREMLFCPLAWYGSAREDDMDWGLFAILFRSIFIEGMSRPFAGVRQILNHLVKKFKALGGQLKMRAGVRQIRVDGKRAAAIVLDDGTEIFARRIISSAGAVETHRMLSESRTALPPDAGKLSFSETISVLDRPPKDLGCDKTVVFFNDSDKFQWRRPADELCDVRTGVICSPSNFAYTEQEGPLADSMMRITALADFDRWTHLSEEDYAAAKQMWYDRMVASAVRFVPDFRPHVIDTDMYTPRTIHRFTWHTNGAVYGAPKKQLDGATGLDNLFLCGTDQGFLGIIGAITGGIAIANRCLQLSTAEFKS
ncbi:MAG: NAD(P)/FAD-dependent oxidoreductase [Planctomycetes bacterium]|nr:NAD(P)/FAD-dependent oxidoreductase [Planctomycetota bacterium]